MSYHQNICDFSYFHYLFQFLCRAVEGIFTILSSSCVLALSLWHLGLGADSWGAECCEVLQFHWLFVLWDRSFSKTYEPPMFIRLISAHWKAHLLKSGCLVQNHSREAELHRALAGLCRSWGWSLKPSAMGTWGCFLCWESPTGKHKANPAFHQQLPSTPI